MQLKQLILFALSATITPAQVRPEPTYDFGFARSDGTQVVGHIIVPRGDPSVLRTSLYVDGMSVKTRSDLRKFMDQIGCLAGRMTEDKGKSGGRRFLVIGTKLGDAVIASAMVDDAGKVVVQSVREEAGRQFCSAMVVQEARQVLLVDAHDDEVLSMDLDDSVMETKGPVARVAGLREFGLHGGDIVLRRAKNWVIGHSYTHGTAEDLLLEVREGKWFACLMSAAQRKAEIGIEQSDAVNIENVIVTMQEPSEIAVIDWHSGDPAAFVRPELGRGLDLRGTAVVPGRSYYLLGDFPAESNRFVPCLRLGSDREGAGRRLGRVLLDGRLNASAVYGFRPMVRMESIDKRSGVAAHGNVWVLAYAGVAPSKLLYCGTSCVLRASNAVRLKEESGMASVRAVVDGNLNDTVGRQVFVQFVYLGSDGDAALSDVCGVVLSGEPSGAMDGTKMEEEKIVIRRGESREEDAVGVVEEICKRLGARPK